MFLICIGAAFIYGCCKTGLFGGIVMAGLVVMLRVAIGGRKR
jgi:hypothetical protein